MEVKVTRSDVAGSIYAEWAAVPSTGATISYGGVNYIVKHSLWTVDASDALKYVEIELEKIPEKRQPTYDMHIFG